MHFFFGNLNKVKREKVTKYGRYVAQHFVKENETSSQKKKNDPLSQRNARAELYLSNRNTARPFSCWKLQGCSTQPWVTLKQSLCPLTSAINLYFQYHKGKLWPSKLGRDLQETCSYAAVTGLINYSIIKTLLLTVFPSEVFCFCLECNPVWDKRRICKN